MQAYDANQPNEARFPGAGPAGNGKQAPLQPPPILNNAPTPGHLFRCLQRRLVLALCLGVVVGGAAGVVAWFVAPEPKHQVRMLISIPAPGTEHFATGERFSDIGSHQRNHAARARSRVVLAAVLRDAKVAKLPLVQDKIEAIEWLEKEVQVDFALAPEIMKISMRGMETDDLLVVVEAVSEAFQKEMLGQEDSRRKGRAKFLEEMNRTYGDRLKRERDKQKASEQPLASKNVNVRAVMLSYQQSLVASTQSDLIRARSALSKARANLSHVEGGEKLNKSVEVREVDVLANVNNSFEITTLRKYVESLEAKKKAIYDRSTKGKKDPGYIQTEEDIKKLKVELASSEKRVRAEVIQKLEELAKANRSTTISYWRQEVTRQEQTIAQLEEEAKKVRDELVMMGRQGEILDSTKEDLTSLEKMVQTLKQQEDTLLLEMKVASRHQVIEPPTVLRADATTRRAMIAGGVGISLFLLCLFGMSWLEHRTRRVGSVDDVVLGLGMRLVGTVPDARKAKASAYNAAGNKVPSISQQVLTESIDAARTTLLHLARSHSLRTVMVTSAVAGEGKTSLSCHLAASLSRAGLRVLLIDADMRNPSAHKLFGMPCEIGFSEVLTDRAELHDCIKATPLRNLAILPAGSWSDKTAAALNQGKAAVLFQQLREQYDIIVVDSSPVLPVADSLLLGQQVDAVVLSVLCEVSRLNNLYAAWQRVQEHGGQPLGVIINGARGSTYGSTYHYPYPRKAKVNA